MTRREIKRVEQSLRELTGEDLRNHVNGLIPTVRRNAALVQAKRDAIALEHRQFRKYWDGVLLAIDAPVVAPDADLSRRNWFLVGAFAAVAAEVGLTWWILSRRGFDSLESAVGAAVIATITTLVAELGLAVAHGLGKLWLDDAVGERRTSPVSAEASA